jgi:pyruvate dehydrogenase E1 component beta subunit
MALVTYSEAIVQAHREEMQRDPTVFALGTDIAQYGGSFKTTKDLWKEFGLERLLNTPISEGAITGAALGAALAGMRPVADLHYIDFCTVAMDQIVQHCAKISLMTGGHAKAPLVIRVQGGGGKSNAAQHSQSLEAWFAHVPGLIVVQPSTPYDAKGLLKSCIRDDNPVMFIEHKGLYNMKQEIPDGEYLVPIGVADVKRVGRDVTVVATSAMVHVALKVATTLAERGIDVEVVDPRTIFPLDEETILASVRKTHRVVVFHEAVRRHGIGAEIAAMIQEKAFDDLDAPVMRVGGKETVIAISPILENAAIPSEADLIRAIEQVTYRKIAA